jgi:hypothetical protein
MGKALATVGAMVIVFAALMIALFVSVFRATDGAAKAADAFVATLGRSGPDAAYDAASPALRAVEPRAAFDARMRAAGYDHLTSVSWSSRSINNDQATVGGDGKTNTGRTLPVQITAVKDGAAWRVTGIGVKPDTGPVDQ